MHIYKWTHKESGKTYIGQSIQEPRQRVYGHLNNLDDNGYLHRAIKKHGIDAFDYEVIDWADDIDALNELEIKYIAEFNCLAPNGYNYREGGGNRGKHHPDSIKRMSDAQKAAHARRKKLGTNTWTRKDGGPMLGKKQSQTQKNMMKEAAKIQVFCPHCGKEGQRAAMGRWHFDNCKELN